MIAGHDKAVEQFRRAWDARTLHHAWLLAGPRGVGKASFASDAAVRVLSEAAGPPFDAVCLDTPDDHPTAKLIAAGSHPDMRWLQRLENEKTGNLARNISVDQVRGLGEFLGLTPALSDWRVVVIDSVDELEKSAANALLKMLEEPPPNTLFLLVSHAPGRLLPTIRSRCRRLQFEALDDDAMTSVLQEQLPDASTDERQRLIPLANGSVGRALAFASLELGPLETDALAILRQGDADNSKRSALASQLARKAAADRYAAFLDLLPSLVAKESRTLAEPQRERALVAYERVRELAAVAPRLSLDPAATVFQLGGILALVADPRLS
ncbi:MAG TPA: DNA polymerase III subunit delta' [Sphingomicrobium sp.]|nr:DNA polymerase III subunit delta' [Sphingomicrobium sp.]